MASEYEINKLAKEESWRMFRIMGELVEGFDKLSGIEPAVTIYGSARIMETDEMYKKTEEIAFKLGKLGYSIVTGGGPGIMEAANKGAMNAKATSVGLNIELPEEQVFNPFTNKSITFNHFFARKVMLVKYATAFIIMPGGIGTLDELSEVLVLMQTQKIKPFPIILFNLEFWSGLMNWLRETVLGKQLISEEDLNLLRICDSTDTVIEIVQRWHEKHELIGRKAII